MKNKDWFLLQLERLSKSSKNALFYLHVDHSREKWIVDLWRTLESEYLLNAAADDTKRHTLTFFFGYPWHCDNPKNSFSLQYDKKKRMFMYIRYAIAKGQLQYIPLKHCPYDNK